MIERMCEIVETPNGGLAALMPIADLDERHWVAVQDRSRVLHARGRVHRADQAEGTALMPWSQQWKSVGMRDVVVTEQNEDFDLGGGD